MSNKSNDGFRSRSFGLYKNKPASTNIAGQDHTRVPNSVELSKMNFLDKKMTGKLKFPLRTASNTFKSSIPTFTGGQTLVTDAKSN